MKMQPSNKQTSNSQLQPQHPLVPTSNFASSNLHNVAEPRTNR